MASNKLPDKLDRLFAMAENMTEGATQHEVALGIKQNTAAVLGAALAAAQNAEADYGAAKVARKTANAALFAADKAGRVFIGEARKRLSRFFGESYSLEWSAAGWPENSTGVPTSQDARFTLINSIKIHLTNNPAHESADMEVTAALAAAAHTAIKDARTALGQKITEAGQAKAARNAAEANLRKRMRGLIDELEVLLGDEDPLWHAFGLSRPADEDTPESPTFTTLTGGGAGALLADWDDPLRADRYRVWLLIVGVDTEFQPVQTVYDSDATLSELPPGATVRVRVTSVNDAGESPAGPEAEAVVP